MNSTNRRSVPLAVLGIAGTGQVRHLTLTAAPAVPDLFAVDDGSCSSSA